MKPAYPGEVLVDEKEFIAFWRDARKRADKLFGADPSGDSWIQIQLVDLSRHESLPYRPVVHGGRCDTVEEHDRRFQTILLNLSTAWHKFELEQKLARSDRHEAEQQRGYVAEIERFIFRFVDEQRRAAASVQSASAVGDALLRGYKALRARLKEGG
jgi:hypothetical protein